MDPSDPVVRSLLDAAVAEFAEHGFAGARVDAIAARTGTSKRMLYYHFASKEGLYAAALAHGYATMQREPRPPPLDEMPPMQALRAYVGFVFDVHVAHPQFVRLVMGENLLGGRFVRRLDEVRASNRLGLQLLERVLQRGQAEGTMRDDLRPLDVYANVVGLAFHHVSNRTTFAAIFEAEGDPLAHQQARRRAIVETIERQVARPAAGRPPLRPRGSPTPG